MTATTHAAAARHARASTLTRLGRELLGALLVACATALTAGPAAAQELDWSDLVARPELRPATCTTKRLVEFESGARIEPGATVYVVDVLADHALVESADGELLFSADRGDTDLLVLARAAWAQLTPAQRALSYPALRERPELWPYRVATTRDVPFGDDTRLEEGRELVLVDFRGEELELLDADGGVYGVEPDATDLMARARQAVVREEPPRARLLEELDGRLVVAATGEPARLDPQRTRLVLFHVSAAWSAPSREFTPRLVAFHERVREEHPELAIVSISADHSEKHMRETIERHALPWLAVPFGRDAELPLVNHPERRGLPHLLVMDLHGRVLANTVRDGVYLGPEPVLERLEALLGAATEEEEDDDEEEPGEEP